MIWLYIIPAVIVWFVSAVVFAVRDGNGEDAFSGTMLGMLLGIAWPSTLFACLVHLTARAVKARMDKEKKA